VIPKQEMESTRANVSFADDRHSNQPVKQEIQRMTNILDAKYSKADLIKIVKEADHLTSEEQEQLYKTLKKKNEDIFDGTLGTFTGKPYNMKLKEKCEPFHAQRFLVPHIHEFTFKLELDHLCSL
jgi:predicted metallo-beta-lactamase superfamily hydrolase